MCMFISYHEVRETPCWQTAVSRSHTRSLIVVYRVTFTFATFLDISKQYDRIKLLAVVNIDDVTPTPT